MKSSTKVVSKSDICIVSMALAAFILCAMAALDTVKATGTGFYMYLKTGSVSREGWDVICLIVILLSVLILAAIPALLMKGNITDASIVFLSNGALTVFVRPDRILAPFIGGEAAERIDIIFRYLKYLPVWIGAIVFILIVSQTAGDVKDLNRIIMVCICVSALFMILGYIVNSAYELFLFASGYALLWPLVRITKESRKILYLVPGVVFFAAMIWKLYMALALYHM